MGILSGGLMDGDLPPVFLTATWRNLVMLNYEMPPSLLSPFLPPGIELAKWEGRAVASIVAFDFADVRLLRIPVPGHRDFQEINLRFYVRRRVAGGWRRGVVFVRELVPLPMVALLARRLYGEPYAALPMDGLVRRLPAAPSSSQVPASDDAGHAELTTVRYSWRHRGVWHRVEVDADTEVEPSLPEPGSEEEFFTDHAYGYGTRRGRTVEYVVEHPTWRYWRPARAELRCGSDTLGALYGEAFVPYLESPRSAYLVEGSPVTVRRPTEIRS